MHKEHMFVFRGGEKMSERRILRNRLRRQRERRRNITICMLTACMILVFSFYANSFRSSAREHTTQSEYKYYTSIQIREGDTLWSIARTFMGTHYDSESAYIEELCRINSLSDEEGIRAGRYLIVPYFNSPDSPKAAGE